VVSTVRAGALVSRGSPDELDAKLLAALERIGQALRVQLWDTGRRHRLTPTQLQVLLRLASDPPDRRRVGMLAAEFDVSHPTISDALAVLRRKRLAEPETGRRGAPLRLTPQGRDVALAVAGWRDPVLTALDDLDAGDKERTLSVLLELIAGLQRAGIVTIARMCVTCRFFCADPHAGGPVRHHCALLDIPLAGADLRVDCPEHEQAA
jgi:DNA-binding MarR family transcriptional regulator